MKQPSLTLPLFLIVFGAIWLLDSLDLFPSATFIISFALIAMGLMVFVLDGVNKQSVVSAPLLMYIGAAIYLRQEYDCPTSPLLALGMVLLGGLMLLARSSAVPPKRLR